MFNNIKNKQYVATAQDKAENHHDDDNNKEILL